jgi:hypothetical protein
LTCDCAGASLEEGTPRTAAIAASSLGAAADAEPNTIVDWVLPSAVMLTCWHPLAP